MNKPNLTKLINKKKNSDNWKIQLTMKITFTPIEGFNDKMALYIKTKKVDINKRYDVNEINRIMILIKLQLKFKNIKN